LARWGWGPTKASFPDAMFDSNTFAPDDAAGCPTLVLGLNFYLYEVLESRI
jgi:hypothetical protein